MSPKKEVEKKDGDT
jgi:hypothetical protein